MFRASFLLCKSTNNPRALQLLISSVADRKVLLKPDDIFKLCVTAAGRDGAALQLLEDTKFVTALRDGAVSCAASLSPFQLNQVKEMCSKAGLEWITTSNEGSKVIPAAAKPDATAATTAPQQQAKAAATTVTPKVTAAPGLWDESTATKATAAATQQEGTTTAIDDAVEQLIAAVASGSSVGKPFQIEEGSPPVLQDVMDALYSARNTFEERSTFDLRAVQKACDTLSPLIPILKPSEISHITSVLARINHQDYTLAQSLSRRACQLAQHFSISECCKMIAKLYKLKVQDSLTVLVRRVEKEAQHLALHDLVTIIHAAHSQSQTTATLQPLVGQCLYYLSGRVGPGHMTVRELVACIEVAAKFGQATNPAVKLIVEGAARRAAEMNDRQLAATLQSAHALGVLNANSHHDLFVPLSERAVALASTMDVRFLEPMLDVFSLLPFNSAPFMDGVLLRLADDAGKLHVHHLVSVAELIASYPGARGSTAVPAIALAAFMRKEVMEPQGIASMILSLAQLQQFNDEFFQLWEFLMVERKGFKSASEVVELLAFVPHSGAISDTRFPGFVQRAVVDLVPVMTQEEAVEMQKQMQRLQIEDRGLSRRLAARLESLSYEAGEAERAAQEAAMRRITGANAGQQHQSGMRRHGTEHAAAEWDMVQQRQPTQQPQHQPIEQQQERRSAAPQQFQQQRQFHQQQQQQSKRPPAAPQQQQQQHNQNKKKAHFKKSQWDGFIE